MVYHVTTGDGTPIKFESGVQRGGIFPGFDLQFGGNSLYVTDTLNLYSVTSDVGRGNIPTDAIITQYFALNQYMSIHNYPTLLDNGQNSYIYGVAPDNARGILYVSVSFAKNVILTVPMNAYDADSFDGIEVLMGDEAATFEMCDNCANAPRAINGYYGNNPADIKLAFPMHIKYHELLDSIFIAESYPVLSQPSYFFGSQTIRRADIKSKIIETYIGVDFSDSSVEYMSYGTLGGFKNGDSKHAEMSYPIAIDISQTLVDGFPQIVVADLENSAIRQAALYIVPTAAPTIRYFTEAPSKSEQFHTSAPTLETQFNTKSPTSTQQFYTSAPSAPSQFVTNAPTQVIQFSTDIPTTTQNFVTSVPTTVHQFSTSAPSLQEQFSTSIPTIAGVPSTESPTQASQFITSTPTYMEQFTTAAPSLHEQFHTALPTSGEQFVTSAPTNLQQFVTSAPSTASQFLTSAPTTLEQFVTNIPTRLEQFVTPVPTPSRNFAQSNNNRRTRQQTILIITGTSFGIGCCCCCFIYLLFLFCLAIVRRNKVDLLSTT